jgi:uncharacterized protein with GYD domain
MPYYLVQGSWQSDAWAALINRPENRAPALQAVIERLGGRLHHYFYAFGDYDIALLVEYPDNSAAAAGAVAASASGAAKTIKTTPLFTQEEALAFLKQAGAAGYRPPST